MEARRIWSAVVCAALALGTATARGQEGYVTSGVVANTVVTSVPIAPPALPGEWNPVIPPDPHHYFWKGPVVSLLRTHACWSHHNLPGCSTIRSEQTFVFGSCRDFFGGPCLKGPPPVLVPAGYQPPAGPSCPTCARP
jgi:hypothetical protein